MCYLQNYKILEEKEKECSQEWLVKNGPKYKQSMAMVVTEMGIMNPWYYDALHGIMHQRDELTLLQINPAFYISGV